MQPGLVSIMMPAYNAGRYIREAIDSVRRQSYPTWELLVVNDGSTDDTGAIASTAADRRIRVFNKPNGGEASARNLALDRATGEYLAFLDADDVFLPRHLEATVAYLKANPKRDGVYTDGFHIDTDGRRLASLQSRRRGPFEGRVYEEVVRASDVFGPPMCVVLRRDLVRRLGLRYDERIVIGPDWDFFRRVAEVASFGYLPEPTGLYRVHDSNITSTIDARRRAEYLAICRENAISGPGFATCSAETRTAVFYDLLVVLLRGQDTRREALLGSAEFGRLPSAQRARLLRLTATDAIAAGGDAMLARAWLRLAHALDPADHRTTLLERVYRVSPRICAAALRARARFRHDNDTVAAPMADLWTAPRRGAR